MYATSNLSFQMYASQTFSFQMYATQTFVPDVRILHFSFQMYSTSDFLDAYIWNANVASHIVT